MMEILENHSLQPYNTFGIEAFADYFIEVKSIEEIKEAIQFAQDQNLSILYLNGGSNMLLTQDWKGLVIKISLKGIELVEETDDHVWIKVQAGENWHEFVQHMLSNDFGGLGNLSLIPGN